MRENRFEGKVVVINGGCKGVGYGVARAVAEEGAIVVASGQDTDYEREQFKKLQDEFGTEGMYMVVELADPDSCENLIYAAAEKYGKVDAYFHYAGVTPAVPLTEITQEDFDFVFDRNIRGAMFGCKAAVKVMEKQGFGSIVLNGSAHGLGGGEYDRVIYGASKGALLTLMKHISNRYATKGIRANYITMGWVPTEGELALRQRENRPEGWLEETAAGCIPLGRLVYVKDMVPGITYLLSDESQMVTGTQLHITGGFTWI